MEKPNNKVKKVICPRCKGNGYIKIPHESVEKLNKPVIAQCTMCESEGEIDETDGKIPHHNDDPNRMH
jgi:transcription elongation factor Elf1|tara:strand:- start:201 stop:404 length:204 start_codon:yes stop_codon:yes gene_type:complete